MSTPMAGAWIQSIARPPRPARLRLFCFPYAGGSPAIFRQWAAGLPPDVEVCPIQLPGRGSRFGERPFERLESLVTAAASALEPLLDRPFAFFGHSMGALVAFELARELRRRQGRSPVLLLLSAHEAPHRPPPLPPFSHLPDDDFLVEVRDRYEGIPDEVLEEPELIALLLPVLRADIKALESHVVTPDTPLDCAVSCFGGSEDRLTREDLEAWREHTSGSFRLRMQEGSHFFLENGRSALLQAISEDLRPWLSGSGPGEASRSAS